MKLFLLSSFIFVTALLGFLPEVWAQESKAQIWRLEITNFESTPVADGFWSSFRRYLFGRAAVQRPPVGTSFTVQSSAYASSPYQTDSTPCLTAAGTRVRQGVVASNFLPLGTRLDINGRPYIVEDRMNPRYNGYFVDLWFPSTSDALEFGRQQLTITIVGYGEVGEELKPVATVEPTTEPAIEQQPSFLTTTGQRLRDLTSMLGLLLGANVNRFDVPCFD